MVYEVNQTKAIIEQALSLNATERTLFLSKIEDQTIKLQVETLLGDSDQLTQFLTQTENHEQPVKDLNAAAISPGTKINRITIEKLLGQGGMGAVYLGFDEKLQRAVAVKSIRPEHLRHKSTQQRFVREAQILSKINHPSICHIYDYMETPHGDFLVLEYIKGKQLFQVGLDANETLDALIELARALAVAHEHGVVHRDLKPDNIMIKDDGTLKVLDFGIAQSITHATAEIQKDEGHKATFELTQQGALMGTIRYMSPEQANGQPIDTASDLYSLGVIAQELLTKQPAYPTLSTNQLLNDVQQGKRSATNDLGPGYQALLTDLTQLNPTDRPSAADVVSRLLEIKHIPRQKKQRRLRWLVAAVAVILLLVAGWQWQQKSLVQDQAKRVNEYMANINQLVKNSEQIYVLPIHNVRNEIDQILQQAAVLFGEIEADKNLSQKDKKRLQGVIFLEAEEFSMAVDLLTEAEAESDYLARAWIGLYIEKILAYSETHGVEQAMQAPVIKEYLHPTLTYIEQAAVESGEVNALYQAFVVSQTESLEKGLVLVNDILAAESWNKRAVKLKALILSALSVRAREAGDWATARAYSVQTSKAFQRSTQMARSYPYDYYSLCETDFALMVDGVQRTGEEVGLYGAQAIQACENYLQTRPGESGVMNLLSRIHMIKAQWELDTGQDADQSLLAAKQWNDESAATEKTIQTFWNQGLIHATTAKQKIMSGADAMAAIELALDAFEQASNLVVGDATYLVSDQLYILAMKASEQYRQQQDFYPTIKRAEALYTEVVMGDALLASEKKGLLVNMAEVYFVRFVADYEQQQNVIASGQQLLGFLNQAENQLQNEPNQLVRLASVHGLMAVYLHQHNMALDDHLDLAMDYIQQARSINSKHHGVMSSQAYIMTLFELRGTQNFSAINALFADAVAANPNLPHTYDVWARSYLLQAQADISQAEQLSVVKNGLQKNAQALQYDETNPTFMRTQKALLALAQPVMP